MPTANPAWVDHQLDLYAERMAILREEGLPIMPIIIRNGRVGLPCVPAQWIIGTTFPPANSNGDWPKR